MGGLRHVALQAPAKGEGVVNMLGVGKPLESLAQVCFGLGGAALVQEGDGEVVVVLRRLKGRCRLRKPLFAHAQVLAGNMRDFSRGPAGGLAKQFDGLLKIAGMEMLHRCIELLQLQL